MCAWDQVCAVGCKVVEEVLMSGFDRGVDMGWREVELEEQAAVVARQRDHMYISERMRIFEHFRGEL